jgi:hypothetical protein
MAEPRPNAADRLSGAQDLARVAAEEAVRQLVERVARTHDSRVAGAVGALGPEAVDACTELMKARPNDHGACAARTKTGKGCLRRPVGFGRCGMHLAEWNSSRDTRHGHVEYATRVRAVADPHMRELARSARDVTVPYQDVSHDDLRSLL